MVKASKLIGVGASEGVVEGPVFAYDPEEVEPKRKTIPEEAVEEELERFRQAIRNVVGNLTETAERLSTSGRKEDAAIVEFHVGLVEDPELAAKVEERVRNLESPEDAIQAVGDKYAQAFEAMDEERMKARADDVRDIAHQIAAELRILGSAVEEELERFRQAVENAVGKLTETAERRSAMGNEEEAGLFEAYAEMAGDPDLTSEVERRVRNLESPGDAVLAVGEEYAAEFAAMDDEYLAARADDVRNVASRIAAELGGGWPEGLEAIETPSAKLAGTLSGPPRRSWAHKRCTSSKTRS